MANDVRTAVGAVLVREQSAEGVPVDPDPTTDGIKTELALPSPSPQTDETDEVLGTLSRSPQVIGGVQMSYGPQILLRGAPRPGDRPNWDVYARIAGWGRTDVVTTASPTVDVDPSTGTVTATSGGVGAITAGTAIYLETPANTGEYLVTAVNSGELTLTGPAGGAPGLTAETGVAAELRHGKPAVTANAVTTAADGRVRLTLDSPWSTADGALDGLPVVVTGGGLAAPAWGVIASHDSDTITLTDAWATPPSAGASVSVPPCVRYGPKTDGLIAATADLYHDGLKFRLKDCVSSLQVSAEAGKIARATVQISGRFVEEKNEPVPANLAYDDTKVGVFRDSTMLIDGQRVALNTVSLDFGNSTAFDGNPNDIEGFDAPVITQRKLTGQVDPKKAKSATQSRLQQLRDGGRHAIHARVTGAQGSRPGHRVALTVPRAQYTGLTMNNRNQRIADQVDYEADGLAQDRDGYVTVY